MKYYIIIIQNITGGCERQGSRKQRTPIKETTTVAQLLVRCLENEDVKYVFGLPGKENKGYKISRPGDLLPTLESALEDDNSVSVIACPVDYSENIKLTDKLGRLTDAL